MPLKAVIFDLDDTLLDTAALLDARDRRAWSEVFGGLDAVRIFEVSEAELPVTSLPRKVRGRGLGVGLYTHSPAKYATELLRAHGVVVDAMVTGSDRLPSKPDPTGLFVVARALGMRPEECIYVGDSVGDFGAAAAAGMTSIGVAWTGRVPESWRHGWPDVAVDKPSNVLRFIDGDEGLGLLGEVLTENKQPAVHFGSMARLGDGVYGLGRYFTTGDRRYPGHPLSHLVLRSKDHATASNELARVFGSLGRADVRNSPNVIVSVPPAPGDKRDRFEAARTAVAEAFGARDGGGVLRQLYAVDDYKSTARDARAGRVAGRFETTISLRGERVLLLDDVLTSGAQSNACRVALKHAGSGGVSVVVASVTQDNNLWDPCPVCGEEYGGRKKTRTNGATGVEFHGCSRYPSCSWTGSL